MCLFCRIAHREAKARIVYEDPDVVAFHDIHPQAPTHVLVIPRKHVASIDAAQDDDEAVLGKLLLRAGSIARELGLRVGGYRVVVNSGEAGGASVDHLHAHLLGGLRMRWPTG